MRRTGSVIIAAAIVALFSFATVSGTTLSWKLIVEPSELNFHEPEPGKVIVSIEGYRGTEFIGYPELPYRVVNVLLPQGEEVFSYHLEVTGQFEVDPSIPLAGFNGILADDGIRHGVYRDRVEVVGKDSVFPGWRVRHVGTNLYRGYQIAAFAVYPMRYNVDTGRLVLETDVELAVETVPAPPRTDRLERMRHVDGFRERAAAEVRAKVINPEAAYSYSFDEIIVDNGDRGFLPSYQPSMEGSEVAYVIVTNEEMSSSFQRLADWKTRKGVPAVVRTVEWIAQNYRSGADLGESIRNFLQEAYAKWGAEWVVLGGDTDIIPARYGFVTFYSGEFIPTDMYYSCLDGTWNADGDSLWGEAFHETLDPGDEVDMYAEVFLGRIPVSSVSEADLQVDKAISYSTPIDTLTKKKFLFLAEVIFPSDYTPGDDIILDGAELTEDIYNSYLQGDPDVTTTRMYETCALYPGTVCLTKVTALDSLEAGTNHVVHVGHGYKYNMSVGSGSIVNYDANNLTNGDGLYAMYLMNCTNVAFDTDCLAEYFLLNQNGGAFAVTGASRSAFPSASRPYMDYYYYLLFGKDVVELGKVHTQSREPYTGSAQGETADRWTHFIYNYLGDPEIHIFQRKASIFSVNVPASADFGSNDITIGVYSGGSPYDSAWVCLYKEGDDYAYDHTNPSGQVTFENFLCQSTGQIIVTVTARNHCRYSDTIQVLDELDPYLRISKSTLQDVIVGNDDDILDAGETVELWPKLLNTGQGDAEKIYAIMRSDDTAISVTDSTALYPDILSGGEEFGLDGFVFSVDSSVEDERAVEFTLEIHDSTGGFWSETFAIEVHAPGIELYMNVLSDTLPYGNNNGVIEAGEDFLLKIGIKNFGTGTAVGLEGKLRSTDVDVTIVDSTSIYGDTPLLGVSYGEGFVLSEANLVENNMLTFEITDGYGRVYTKEAELRKPGKPTGVILDSSHGPTEIHVTWHSPGTDEKYRYIAYHSLIQGGPYDQASPDLVFHTLFRDRGLDPSTRYYIVVATVDSCGNVGSLSDEATTTTNPPQLAGWPNKVGKETASSPKITDIDGDTRPDVVVGSEFIYAWHGDGIEIRDGDNQPITWGILNTEGDNFTATVALGNLDGNPGAEIVGASWNTKEIFVFGADGSTLPGWPQVTNDLCWASPVLGDLDDDGDLEVIAYDVDGIVYVWHHDGTELLDGDSNVSTNGPFFVTGSPGMWHVSTPAVADIDNDGVVELVVCSPDDSIYCLNGDGSAVPGWPVPVEDAGANISASPAVGDIDDDGDMEIVVQSSSARVYGLNHDGTCMSGWPKWVYSNAFFVGSPALGDLTGDGKLEVIIPSASELCYAFRYNGGTLPGWPQPYASSANTECSVVIADLDGDGSLDIILGSEEGLLNAWDAGGNYIPGFPVMLSGFVRGTPMVHDLDLDGDLELIASCWDQNIYVWDLSADRYHGCMVWNGFHGNVHNTGWMDFVGPTPAEIMAWQHRFVHGHIELSWQVIPEFTSWNLYRREAGSGYEILYSGLESDETGYIHFIDRASEEGLTYGYRLEADGRPGLYIDTDDIEVPVAHARLYQNHPNPFNPTTTIAFTVPGGSGSRSGVLIAVYDVRGARVKTLVNEALPGGRHTIRWNGTNHRGEPVASGVYFTRMVVGGVKDTKKMVLLR